MSIAKRMLSLLLCGVMLACAGGSVIALDTPETPQVSVWLNGKQMEFNIKPLLQNGVTFVSLYDFCTMLGCEVLWHDGYATVTRGDELSAVCTPGQIYMTANERALYMPTPAKIVNDRIMIPIRILATLFDMGVEWDGVLMRVNLSGGGLLKSGDDYYDYDTLYWLSRIISAEARGEPLIGQIAVGNVVFNRVADEQFPETVYGVIFDQVNGVQFTPTENGSIWCNPNTDSVIAAKIVLEGYRTDPDILFFMNEETAVSTWISDNCEYAFTIADHSFWS